MSKPFTEADVARWNAMIGVRVWKNPKTNSKHEPKPFKSGSKINTVKAVVVHQQTGGWGFTFEEDESVVECFRCSPAPEGRYDSEFLLGDIHMGVTYRMSEADMVAEADRLAGDLIDGDTEIAHICYGV
jgi:hypothetical protein